MKWVRSYLQSIWDRGIERSVLSYDCILKRRPFKEKLIYSCKIEFESIHIGSEVDILKPFLTIFKVTTLTCCCVTLTVRYSSQDLLHQRLQQKATLNSRSFITLFKIHSNTSSKIQLWRKLFHIEENLL